MANPFFSDDELAALRRRRPEDVLSRKPAVAWLRATGRPVYIFGAGEAGLKLLGMLRRGGVPVPGAMDNDPAKWGASLDGVPVSAPAEAAERARRDNALVMVSVADDHSAGSVMRQCREFGLEWVDHRETKCLEEGLPGLADLAENPRILESISLWDDAESRDVFRSVVRYRTTLDPADLPDCGETQYFIGAMPLVHYRNFVDVGAFTGDTLREFLSRFGEDFDSYHAIEPNPLREKRLEESARGDGRVRIHMTGVSNYAGTARARLGTCLVFDPAGEVEVGVARIDDLLGNDRVGLIKMDIEGVEPEALAGAEKIIRRDRPALAISAYHLPEHLWSIPQWIRNFDPGYRLLLRHHSHSIVETICYAIPE